MTHFRTLIWLLCIASALSFHRTVDSGDVYLADHKHLAIEEMERTGIPASIKMAQAILETNSGKSVLARRANNHFGLKCKSYWTGPRYFYTDDDRDAAGNLVPSCFRMYDSVEDSFKDHSDFLVGSERYASLFETPMSSEEWAKGLQKCGYATNPEYSERLIKTIEKYDLDALNTAGDQ